MFLPICLICSIMAQEKIQIDERIRVSFVSLDVMAFHKKNGLVTDLRAEDFIIKENGKQVPISHFEVRDFRDTAEHPNQVFLADAAYLPQNQTYQQVIFVLDLEATLDNQPYQALEQLKQAVEKLGRLPHYKIAVYSMESGMLTDGFETQMGVVLEQLERYKNNYENRGHGDSDSILFPKKQEPFKMGVSRRGRMSQLDTETPDITELERSFEACLNLFTPGERMACMDTTLRDFMEWHTIRTERVIGQLESLAYAFEENNDLKIMMLISPGFGLNQMQSAQKLLRVYKGMAEGHQQQPRHSIRDMSASSTYLSNDQSFKRVLHACIRNRVIFHTFDLFNSSAAMSRQSGAARASAGNPAIVDAFRQYQRDMDMGLRELASESGGEFRSSGVFADSALDVLDQSQFFYVIGYRSPPGDAGSYRKIKIKVKRKKVKLSYRTGYFGG